MQSQNQTLYTNINIIDDEARLFKYVIGYDPIPYKTSNESLQYTSGTIGDINITYIFDENVNIIHKGDYWQHESLCTDKHDITIPNHKISKLYVYFPRFSVETYNPNKNILYALTINTWINGRYVMLGSYLISRIDALAMVPKKLFGDEYVEYLEIDVLNLNDFIYNPYWDDMKNQLCGGTEYNGSLLNISLYPVTPGEVEGEYIMLQGYSGSQNAISNNSRTEGFLEAKIQLYDDKQYGKCLRYHLMDQLTDQLMNQLMNQIEDDDTQVEIQALPIDNQEEPQAFSIDDQEEIQTFSIDDQEEPQAFSIDDQEEIQAFSIDDQSIITYNTASNISSRSALYDNISTHLIFTALEDGEFGFSKSGLSYSIDNGLTWTELNAGETVSVSTGGEVLWKATTQLTSTTVSIGTFTSTNKFDVSGNIMSLLFGDDYTSKDNLKRYTKCFYRLFKNTKIVHSHKLALPATELASWCYRDMFYGCTSLTTAPELPATELADYCYAAMFNGCTSLITTPELPATELAPWCYYEMFYGCDLITAPELPAITLMSGCYQGMFRGCTSLTIAPELPVTTLVQNCYADMFNGCTSLITAPELPAITLAHSCYSSMFSGCTSLTTAPELPATTLAQNCYAAMFNGCTSLTTAPELPATELMSGCYQSMFYNCSALKTVPGLPATTLAQSCYSSMFSRCTSLTTAPELPATTLVTKCYQAMFVNCSKLNYIKALFTELESDSLTNWVKGVSATGTFIKHLNMTALSMGISGIPSGWNMYNYNDSQKSDNSVIVGDIKSYLRDIYKYPISDDILNIEYNIVLKNDSDIYTTWTKRLTNDSDVCGYINITDLTELGVINLSSNPWDWWKQYEEEVNKPLVLQGVVTFYGGADLSELFYIKTNEIPVTQEVYSYLIVSGERKINLDEIKDMNVLNINVVQKTVQEVHKYDTVNDAKSNIIQPIFYKVRELGNITIHPAVTENICINLDQYKSKVNRFILQIEGCAFHEIGRTSAGVIFKVAGSILPKVQSSGLYYILNEDSVLITNGNYNYVL